MNSFYLTRKQLQVLGLSAYLARLVSRHCSVHQKQGNAHLYSLTDIRLAAQAYQQRSRIRPQTRRVLQVLIQQLMEWEQTVIAAPFRQKKSEHHAAAIELINTVSETSKFQLRAMELRGKVNHV